MFVELRRCIVCTMHSRPARANSKHFIIECQKSHRIEPFFVGALLLLFHAAKQFHSAMDAVSHILAENRRSAWFRQTFVWIYALVMPPCSIITFWRAVLSAIGVRHEILGELSKVNFQWNFLIKSFRMNIYLDAATHRVGIIVFNCSCRHE